MKITFELEREDAHLIPIMTNAEKIYDLLFHLQKNFAKQVDHSIECEAADLEEELSDMYIQGSDKATDLLFSLMDDCGVPLID